MNYFAHGRDFTDDPYFLSGTAVPDWLSVVDRRVRVRRQFAARYTQDRDAHVSSVARGIVQHCQDDDWFHRSRAFAELSLDFTRQIRGCLSPDTGLRPSFLGHILVEILLDAELMAEDVTRLDAYYQALEAVDARAIGRAVNLMANQSTDGLEVFVHRFRTERFLYDYAEDAKLLFRLNQVMRRVNLDALPDGFLTFFPDARRQVHERRTELLDRTTALT
jgi:hypothetical protein